MFKIQEMSNGDRLGGQGTGKLQNSLIEIINVVAKKTRWNLDNIANNQTIGAVASQTGIGEDARNLGLRMKSKLVGHGYSPAIYAALGGGRGSYFRTERG